VERIGGFARVPFGGSEDDVRKSIELNCDDYHVKTASIAQNSREAVFRCTIGPLPDTVLEEEAARAHATLRLVFSQQPLVLERIDVIRVEPGSIQIVGRVVESP
jgi:hypothetical protein